MTRRVSSVPACSSRPFCCMNALRAGRSGKGDTFAVTDQIGWNAGSRLSSSSTALAGAHRGSSSSALKYGCHASRSTVGSRSRCLLITLPPGIFEQGRPYGQRSVLRCESNPRNAPVGGRVRSRSRHPTLSVRTIGVNGQRERERSAVTWGGPQNAPDTGPSSPRVVPDLSPERGRKGSFR
jgi:hypothetical protein